MLAHFPGIAEAAVVRLPDDRWGEVVTAVVVVRPGTVLDRDALRDSCRQHLAGYKVPKRIATVTALPRNAAGKVLKRRLREQVGHGSGG